MKRRELQDEFVISKLERKFIVKRKGAEVVHEEVRQKLVAVRAKLEGYDKRTEHYRQNRSFESYQKKLFKELKGTPRERRGFWSDIWNQAVTHRGKNGRGRRK